MCMVIKSRIATGGPMDRYSRASLMWRKASRSSTDGACVELAALPDGCVAMRDSKDPCGPVLSFTQAAWSAFVTAMAAGEFDSLHRP